MLFRIILLLLVSVQILMASIEIEAEKLTIDDFYMGYYQDSEGNLTIEDIQGIAFTKERANRFSLAYIRGKSWFKLDIHNDKNNSIEEFVLYFHETYFDKVNLYDYYDLEWRKRSVGVHKPLEDRDIKDRNPAFTFNLKAGEHVTFYLQVDAKLPKFSEVTIYEHEAFYEYHRVVPLMFYMFYFGTLIIILGINAFLFIRIKDRLYGYYFGYSVFHVIFIFLLSGLSVYIGINRYYHFWHISAPLLMMFLILFSNIFLEINNYLPKIEKVLKFFQWVFAALAVSILYDIELFYPILTLITSLVFLLLTSVSIYMIIKGSIKAHLYLFAISIYLISMVLFTFMANGWLEYTIINRYAFLLGSFFEVSFFTFLLLDRFITIQKKRIVLLSELVKVKNIHEKELQEKVEERSSELTHLLSEKELLLKEIHHRVKNNFQMVTNILWFEANKKSNEKESAIFAELHNRINSMSNIHEIIYTTESLSHVDSKKYFSELIENTLDIYSQYNIDLIYQIDTVLLELDDASSLGGIINEVLVNAIKHHPDKERCIIEFSFACKENDCVMTIEDNGSGFNEFERTKYDSIGMLLISQFTQKLKRGISKFTINKGTVFTLNFKIS